MYKRTSTAIIRQPWSCTLSPGIKVVFSSSEVPEGDGFQCRLGQQLPDTPKNGRYRRAEDSLETGVARVLGMGSSTHSRSCKEKVVGAQIILGGA